LGGLQDDHLSTFGGFFDARWQQASISASACIFAVFWPQNGLKTCQIHEIGVSNRAAWGFNP
jgi:hypothetical protein